MLSLLKIKNLALVDSLEWQLDTGLVGVTGETGAGKSVIVGALKLVLGDRADKGLIRTGESSCVVEAVFDLPNVSVVNAVLEESGLDPCDEGQLIVKRVVGQSSNKQFINNSPATLSVLKKLGQHLVDLHGPHDHQGLLSTERQLVMLDAYAGAGKLMENYRGSWKIWKEASDQLKEFREQGRVGERELDLLKHQVNEIDAARLQPGEEEGLAEQYQRASNSAHLIESASSAVHLLSGSDSALLDNLGSLTRLCRDLEKLDPSLRESLSGVDKAVLELQEVEAVLQGYLEEVNTDPQVFAELEERINTLESMKRKYGATLEEVLAYRDEIQERLDSVENREALTQQMEELEAKARSEMNAIGEKLSALRRAAAPR